jgi:serine/threonine-protein kinase HipA
VALSHSLPLRPDTYDDKAARGFFSGLLPEGEKRKLVATALQVSRVNDFAILNGIGGECAGAVSFLPPGSQPSSIDEAHDISWLDDTALIKLLDELPRRPMLAGVEGIRLSLAGAQDKLPVVVDGDRIGLPLHGQPSSHILKPSILSVTDSVPNEGFCMALARAIGIKAANTRICHVDNRPFLLVERYDRFKDEQGHLQRLHQEDFCQALGVAPEYKYQNEGGPDLAQCFSLLRQATKPSAPQILRLLDYIVFNVLIGNHDTHGKNFSLLYNPAGTVLAPLYDALSTAVYADLTPKMAMKLGSKYKFSDVMARHWDQFAHNSGLSAPPVRKRIIQLAKQLPVAAKKLQEDRAPDFANSALISQIIQLIDKRCTMTLRSLLTGHAL